MEALTKIELLTLNLLIEGLTVKEIAAKRSVSSNTIRRTLQNSRDKVSKLTRTNIPTNTRLAILAKSLNLTNGSDYEQPAV